MHKIEDPNIRRVVVRSIGRGALWSGAIIASLVATLALPIGGTTAGAALGELDYDSPKGHFYTQANGHPLGTNENGFELTNEGGIAFWGTFVRLGGVEKLGYPTSNRYACDGSVCQATQRGVLQWNPAAGRVALLNTFDLIASHGHDEWLRAQVFVPPASGLAPDPPVGFAAIFSHRLSQLADDQVIYNAYVSDNRSLELYGLPLSSPQRIGDAVAVRFQRNVLYYWVGKEQVFAALAGDLAKQVGLVPVESLTPRPPPPKSLHGIATWYGAYFHGNVMANGQIYDMYDATLAASNIFPFGTRLRVTRLDNGESIVVRVTDRGAFQHPILVDLSWAAFSELGLPAEGVIGVSVHPIG